MQEGHSPRNIEASAKRTTPEESLKSSGTPYESAVLQDRIWLWILSRLSPLAVAALVLFLTFFVQCAIAWYERTLLPSTRVNMSLVQHFTIVVGGGFLIPMLFYTMGRYYRVSDDALKQLRHDGILAGNFAFGRSSLLCRFPVLVRSIIGLFVGFLVFLQVSQANRDVNYSHILNGNFTKCGIYYLCLFPILAYGILLFVIDTACFGRSVSNLCTKHLLKPALFHPDGRYGFRRLIGSTFYIHLTIVLIGVYFVVMFVSWRNYRSMPQLFDRTEHVLIFVSYLSLCPIVLWWLLHPLRRLLVDFKSGLLRRLYEGLRLERLVGNDPHTTGLMEELDGKGFYPLYERIAALTTNVVTLDLLAKVYTSIIVPVVVPIGTLWIQKKFFS